jgi:hypothetical protein
VVGHFHRRAIQRIEHCGHLVKIALCSHTHRTQFVEREAPTVLADTHLHKKHRAGRVDLDQDRQRDDQRAEDQHTDNRTQNIECAFDSSLPAGERMLSF